MKCFSISIRYRVIHDGAVSVEINTMAASYNMHNILRLFRHSCEVLYLNIKAEFNFHSFLGFL